MELVLELYTYCIQLRRSRPDNLSDRHIASCCLYMLHRDIEIHRLRTTFHLLKRINIQMILKVIQIIKVYTVYNMYKSFNS